MHTTNSCRLFAFAIFIIALKLTLTPALALALTPGIIQGWQYGSTHNDMPYGVHTDPQGNIIVVGASDTQIIKETSNPSFFIAKFRSSGKMLWRIQIAKSGSQGEPLGVAVDSDSQIYVVGRAYGPLFGKWLGDEDAFLAKWSPSGKLIWGTQFGTSAEDEATTITVGKIGQIYIAGITSGSLFTKKDSQRESSFTATYSPGGALIAGNQRNDDMRPGAIITDTDGNLYVAADGGSPTDSLALQGPSLGKYNPAMQLEWVHFVNSAYEITSNGLSILGESVYLVGRTNNNHKDTDGEYNPVEGAYLACFSTSGKNEWTKTWRSNLNTAFLAVVADKQYVYTAGYEEILHQPIKAFPQVPWIQNHRALVSCVTNNGREQWSRSFGATERSGVTGLILIHEHLYAIGFTNGSLFGKWNKRTRACYAL